MLVIFYISYGCFSRDKSNGKLILLFFSIKNSYLEIILMCNIYLICIILLLEYVCSMCICFFLERSCRNL